MKFKVTKSAWLETYLPYFLSLTILIVFLGVRLKLCLTEKDQEYYRTLRQVEQIYFGSVQNEIIKTLNILEIAQNKAGKAKFLNENLLFNFIRISNITEHRNKSFKVEAITNSVKISAGFYTILIDTNLLQYLIVKNIPTNINFEIHINDQIVASNGKKGTVFIKNKINTSFLSSINMILSIKEDFLFKDKSRVIKNQLLEFVIIIMPIIIINIIFRKFYLRSIINRFKTMRLAYSNLLEEQSLLSQHIRAKTKYNELLIAKLKQKIKSNVLEGRDILNDISWFPVLIEEGQYTAIDNAIFLEA